MKTLQELLQDELVCGKQLFEKLKIRKAINKQISIPIVNNTDNIIYKNKEWKKITLPKEDFVIYMDKYHSNIPHLAYIDDFLFQMMQFQDDYEDFDMNKDILFASDDEQEIAEWYIKKYLKLELPEDNGDTADWVNSQETNKRIYDSLNFIHDVYLGYDHIDTDLQLNKTNIEKLASSFNGFICWDIE